jgi:hypothetical protein
LNKVLISFKKKKTNDAGSKAKNDVILFLKNKGFILFSIKVSDNLIFNLINMFICILFKLPSENVNEYIVQYPIDSLILFRLLVCLIKLKSKSKIFLVVHDVESIRFYLPNNELKNVKKELGIFNLSSGLIIHNKKMYEWLKEKGVKVPMSQLSIFDYYTDYKPSDIYDGICFAGNLKKSNFINKLNITTKLNLYGPCENKRFSNNVNYMGVFTPEQLPYHLKGKFGLVWDGDSTEECVGNFGYYLKYNSPHKLSLYLSCGIPVIVWEKSAVSNFIKSNGLGMSIDNLSNIDDVYNSISEEEYTSMRNNALKLSSKLKNGVQLLKAINFLEGKN